MLFSGIQCFPGQKRTQSNYFWIEGEFGSTPLGEAARHGYGDLVRIMLKSLDQRSIPLEKLQRKLAEAELQAEICDERGLTEDDIRPLLRRFYWRKKYQDMPTSWQS